jgi:hypothetical protein
MWKEAVMTLAAFGLRQAKFTEDLRIAYTVRRFAVSVN